MGRTPDFFTVYLAIATALIAITGAIVTWILKRKHAKKKRETGENKTDPAATVTMIVTIALALVACVSGLKGAGLISPPSAPTTEQTTEEEEEDIEPAAHPDEFSESQTITDEYLLELIAEAQLTELPDSSILSGTITYKATGAQFEYYYARPRFNASQIPITIARDIINNKLSCYSKCYEDHVYYEGSSYETHSYSLYGCNLSEMDQETLNEMKAMFEWLNKSGSGYTAKEFSSYSVDFVGNYVSVNIDGYRGMWGGTGEAFMPHTMIFDCRTGKQLYVSDVVDAEKGAVAISAAVDAFISNADSGSGRWAYENSSSLDMFIGARIAQEGVYLQTSQMFSRWEQEVFVSKSSLKEAGALKIDW